MAALMPRVFFPVIAPFPRFATLAGRLLPTLGLALPSISINIPSLLDNIWEGILRAVPKKKTSYSKKRMRQLANRGLQDTTSLVECSACGGPKQMNHICRRCLEEMRNMWRSEERKDH